MNVALVNMTVKERQIFEHLILRQVKERGEWTQGRIYSRDDMRMLSMTCSQGYALMPHAAEMYGQIIQGDLSHGELSEYRKVVERSLLSFMQLVGALWDRKSKRGTYAEERSVAFQKHLNDIDALCEITDEMDEDRRHNSSFENATRISL